VEWRAYVVSETDREFTPPMLTRRREVTEQRCRDWCRTLVEFNSESDHIPILMSLPSNLDLSRFVNNLKTAVHG
jgi:putative transposase